MLYFTPPCESLFMYVTIHFSFQKVTEFGANFKSSWNDSLYRCKNGLSFLLPYVND